MNKETIEIAPQYERDVEYYSVECSICGEIADGIDTSEDAHAIAWIHYEDHPIGEPHWTQVIKHHVFVIHEE